MWWVWPFLLFVSVPYILILCFVGWREYQTLPRCANYISQNFGKFYSTFFGYLALFTPDKENLGDGLSTFRKVLAKADKDGKNGIVANNPWKKSASIILTDFNLIKEFLLQCNNFTERVPFDTLPWKSYFLFASDGKLPNQVVTNAILRIFGQKGNSANNIKLIQGVVKHSYANIFRKGESVKTIDFKYEAAYIVKKVFQSLILGENVDSYSVYNGKVKLMDALVYAVAHTFGENGIHASRNIFFAGLPNKLGFLAGSSQVKPILTESEEALRSLYMKRYDDQSYKPGLNFIDLITAHNVAKPEEKVLQEEIFNAIMDLLTIGYLPTSISLSHCYYSLANLPELQTKILEEVAEQGILLDNLYDISPEELNKLKLLRGFIREVLRVCSPIALTLDRRVFRKTKIGKVEFGVGDYVQVPINYIMSAEPFASSEKFKIETFLEEGEKRTADPRNLTFGKGGACCPAQQLAENILKVSVLTILRDFELSISQEEKSQTFLSQRTFFEVNSLNLKISKKEK